MKKTIEETRDMMDKLTEILSEVEPSRMSQQKRSGPSEFDILKGKKVIDIYAPQDWKNSGFTNALLKFDDGSTVSINLKSNFIKRNGKNIVIEQ